MKPDKEGFVSSKKYLKAGTGENIEFWSKHILSSLLIGEKVNKVFFTGIERFSFLWKSMIMMFKKVFKTQ